MEGLGAEFQQTSLIRARARARAREHISATMAKSDFAAEKQQPPPGYPTAHTPDAQNKRFPRSKKKGDRGFIEGCLFALCCCWLCEACF